MKILPGTSEPKEAPSTMTDGGNQVSRSLNDLRKISMRKLKGQEQVLVSIPPMYAPYFGNNMPISINGVLVCVPADGEKYSVPQAFADVLQERIKHVDESNRKKRALADISRNIEARPGELLI